MVFASLSLPRLLQLMIIPANAGTFAAPVQEGDRLLIKGVEAQVQLISNPSARTLKISGIEGTPAEGQFVLTKKDHVIEVQMNEFEGKKEWMAAISKNSSPAKKIEITSLAIPTEIHLQSGSVVAQKWSKELKVSLSRGRVSSAGGTGGLFIFNQKGEVSVQDHIGKVHVDSYTGALSLKNIQGDIEASLFAGPLTVEKAQGFVSVNSRGGPVKISQSGGALSFENGTGALSVQGFLGRIDGQNQEGSVNIQMALDSELEVKSKAGRIQIQTSPGSGSSVNLSNLDGDIFVPNELHVNKQSSEKNVKGRLRGEAQRGVIIVRSQEGVILVK
jgi:hypothetical protein